MTKIRDDFDPLGYATVAERVRLFWDAHPQGRIETELVSRTEHEVVFKALVYRGDADARPAATGWAAEREGDGDVNLVACLENTETSAIGRALANLGFTASRQRPSAEEMAKASRARASLRVAQPTRPVPAAAYGRRNESDLPEAMLDALRILGIAERAGLAPERAAHFRRRLRAGVSLRSIERLESVLRRWMVSHPSQYDT